MNPLKTYSNNQFRDPAFPLAVRYEEQESQMPPHKHDFLEIVLVAKGSTIHNVCNENGQELSCGLVQGDFFSILPGEIHSYTHSRKLRLYNILLGKEFLDHLPEEISTLKCYEILFPAQPEKKRTRLHLRPLMREEAMRSLGRILSALTLCRPEYRLEVKTAFLEFLLTAENSSLSRWNLAPGKMRMKFFDSLELLESEPEKPLTLAQLASVAGMSIASYTKHFREATGLSPMDYRIGIRIDIARRLLLNTDMTISEIAWKTGFVDSNYLIKQFKKREGIPPARLRKFRVMLEKS